MQLVLQWLGDSSAKQWLEFELGYSSAKQWSETELAQALVSPSALAICVERF